MSTSILKSQIDDLNNYTRGEANEDVAISSLDTLLNTVTGENDEKKIEILLPIVFNETNGYFQFLKDLKKLPDDKAKHVAEKSFEFLKYLLSGFPNTATCYIPEIFDICKTNSSWATSTVVKQKSYELLIFIVENTSTSSFFLENAQTLRSFFEETISKTESVKGSTELKYVYLLIGSIIDCYREIVTDKNKKQLLRKLKSELVDKMKKESITVLEGCYECLRVFLKQFGEELSLRGDKSVYTLVKKGCELDSTRKTSVRAALRVIGECFSLFGDHVYDEYEFWYFKLSDDLSCPNKADYMVALRTLDVFYSNMAKLLAEKEDAKSKDVLKFFLEKLKYDLSIPENRKMMSAMKNFGHFASTCKKFGLNNEVESMFNMMAGIADKYYSGVDEENMELFHLTDLLVSLTFIISCTSSQGDNFDENKLNVLARITNCVIVSFPKVASPFRDNVRRSILEAVVRVGLFNTAIFNSYLEKFVYCSLIGSCSALMKSDAELVKGDRNFAEEPVSAPEYNPVWIDLCNITRVKFVDRELDNKIPEFQRQGLHATIFDNFIAAVLKMIDKLDFSLMEDGVDEPSNCVIPIDKGSKPHTENDYYIFANLVQLFSHVIAAVDFDILRPWISKLTETFIDLAAKCPIKNGFFELLSSVLKRCKMENDWNEETQNLKPFLLQILSQIPEFKGPDLISCLHIMMNVPRSFIEDILPYMTTLFQNVFTLGLQNISLAREGLNTLNEWYLLLSAAQLDTILPAVIPHLHSYLDSTEFKGDTDAITKYEEGLLMPVITQRKNKLHRKFFKAYADTTHTEQHKLRVDIMRFLSKINIDRCSSMYSIEDFTLHETTDVLKFDLPYVDMKVRIYLDKCLPRIMELARNSSDIRTRTIACEVLHSVTTIFIGNTAHDLQSLHPKGAEILSRNLLICIFKLGSDLNGVVCQLYRPLCFQLMHYFSSNVYESRNFVTNVLLEILFNGVSNEDDTLYKQFSGELIREFVDWSIKQSKRDQHDAQVNSNVVAVVKRIYLFCMLPCSKKRLGAAIAFNNIYRQLREEQLFVENYWIEMLYHFVRSLDCSGDNDCNNKQTAIALDHVKRVLCERSDLFVQSCRRRLPKDLQGGSLTHIVNWLFTFCTSRNRYCRIKCVSLVEELTARSEYGSFENYFNVVGRHKVTELVCENVEVKFRPDGKLDCENLLEIVNWMENLLSGLYRVNWLVTKRVVNVDHLFASEAKFADTMKFYVRSILPLTKHNFITPAANQSENFTKTISSFELIQRDIFLIVLSILANSSKENFALFVAEDALWDKFVSLLFEPARFLLDETTNENWSKKVTQSILEYTSTLPESTTSNPIFAKIDNFIRANTFLKSLNDISKISFTHPHNQRYVDALNVLQVTNVLPKIIKDIDVLKKEVIKRIYASIGCNGVAVSFNSKILSFLEKVTSFCLVNAEITFVVELVFNSTELRDARKSASVSYGRHFFGCFKKALVEYLGGHQASLMRYCLQEPASISSAKIRTLFDCVVEASESKKTTLDEVICEIYANWKTLTAWSQGSDTRRSLLLELIEKTIADYRQLEKYDKSSIAAVFRWLLTELTCVGNSVMTKKRLVGLLSSILVEKLTDDEVQLLRECLNSLQRQHFTCTNATSSDDHWNVILFNALLRTLAVSRCTLVLEFVCRIRCMQTSINSCDNRIQQVLAKLCESTSDEQLALLSFVYEICQQQGESIEFRANCVQIFLTPLLYASVTDAVRRFFRSKLAHVWNTFAIPLQSITSSDDVNLNNKTIAVMLIDVYSEVIADFDDPEITMQVFPDNRSSIRKEFFKQLRDIVLRRMNVTNGDNVDRVRKLQCHAFNALIKVIRRVHRQEEFYKLVFIENPGRDMFVWRRIVDCNARIELRMVPDRLSSHKKKIKQQKFKIRSSRAKNAYLSIPTQYLATSSLVDDVVRHDMSEWNIADGSQRNANIILDDYSIDLEEDKLNNHECMASLCELINFIFQTGISAEPKADEQMAPVIPAWMECIRESLKWYASRPNQENVIMFILKLIRNSDRLFRPFAAYWVDLIVKSLCVLQQLNYFVVEVIVMLLDWNAVATPKNQESKEMLLNFVINKVDEGGYSTSIENYLFDLIDTMIMTWHEGLRASTYSAIYVSAVSVFNEKKLALGLKICKQFLSTEIVPFDDGTKQPFIGSLLAHSLMQGLKRNNLLLMFEVTALTLRVLENKPDVLSIEEHSALRKRLIDCLNSMNVENVRTKTDLFFSCLLRTVTYYPNVLQSFASYLLNSFAKFQGEIKTKCLKILNADVSQLPDNAFTVLMRQNFVCCIGGSDNYELRRNALKTIKLCLEKIQQRDLQHLMADIWKLSTDVLSECRAYVYDIADFIYERNKDETEGERFEMKIKCKAILLNGLLDSDSALQQKLFSSWIKRLNLDGKIAVRFEQIVEKLYSPLNESQFVCNAANFLLDGCRQTPDYESKIFDNPLFGGCRFEKYEVNLSYRSVASHTPLFGSSFTSKFLTLSQSSDFGSSSIYVRETQDKLMFQPTLDSQMEAGAELGAGVEQFRSKSEYAPFGAASETQSAVRKLKRPLYESSAEASVRHASRNVRKRDKREELLKEMADDKPKTVNLYRRYRRGEIPDIEIPRSALIEPLIALAKRDPIIGKLVFMSCLEGILRNVDKEMYLSSLNGNLNELCKMSPLRDGIFVEALFEIAFNYSPHVRFDTQHVMNASYASGLHSFGALLLEESISASQNAACEKRSSKKMKTDGSDQQQNTWTQLAELYKALDQTDVVNGILKEKLTDTICGKLKQGLEFEQSGDKKDALKQYEELMDESSARLEKCHYEHFVLEAYSNCAAYLSKWHDLNGKLGRKFANVNDLWNNDWNVETTLPWFLASEAYTCTYDCIFQQRSVCSKHMNEINAWLANDDRNLVLMNLVPESIVSMLVLVEKQAEALVFINECVKLILNDWRRWKSTEDTFAKVQTLLEFEAFLSNRTESTTIEKIDEAIEIWRRNSCKLSNSVLWDKRIVQKLFFKKKYSQLIASADEENSAETLQRLDYFELETILSFIENALDDENLSAACQYTRFYDKINNEEKLHENIAARYELDLNRLWLLQGIKGSAENREEDFQNCLEGLRIHRKEIAELYPYEYYTHIAGLCSAIIESRELMTCDPTYWSIVVDSLRTVVFEGSRVSADDVMCELPNAILSNYEKAAAVGVGVKTVEDVSSAYLKAAQFCRKLIDEDEENERYQRCLVRMILKAMKFDSKEGQMLFPTLLQLSRITSDSVKHEFLLQSAGIEEWKFLPWISQLLAYVDVTNMLPIIEHIVVKTATKYPTAVYSPYLMYKEKFSANFRNEAFAIRLKNILETNAENAEISTLIKELAFVRVPVTYFAHCWRELKKASADELVEVAEKMDAEMARELPTKGRLFRDDVLSNALKNCLNSVKNGRDAQQAIDSFGETVSRRPHEIGRQPRKEWLTNFNPWLVDGFTKQCPLGVEMPGQYDQYDGCARPDARRHVKIYEFAKKVEVQNSKQQPIKIELIGTDGNTYAYLIKFEEDMRQDQRIQQIFAILNRCVRGSNLRSSTKTVSSATTYSVFPLNSHFAMIEWVNNTATLKDFMDFGCSDEEKQANENTRSGLQNEYVENLRKKYYPAGIATDLIRIYEESMKRFDKITTVASFKSLSSRIPHDVFRKSLLSLCHASNEFWQLRNQFVSTYATICIYGWILGIGDRHLKNTLVCLKTGNCIGIDFGVAFGTGIENLRIPELIPFRLTPHIEAIMAPFFLTGLIRETMINILQVIRDSKYVLLGTLQIFILDPSSNWINTARNRMPQLKPDITIHGSDDLYTQFCPKQISIVKRKLRGEHPMQILQEQLMNNSVISAEHRNACHGLVEKLRLETTSPVDCLTVVQQVDCLLDLATDERILGTSWHGLETYI